MDSRIEILYRQYLQQVELDKLSFPPNHVLMNPQIQSQMFRFMFTTHLMFPSEYAGSKVYLPPISYQKRVLKELIRRMEAGIHNSGEDVGQFPSMIANLASILLCNTYQILPKLFE